MPDDPTANPEDPALSELRKSADELKAKIAEAKARNDMPLDANLGNPGWEKRAADGSLDVGDDEDE